MVLPSAVRQGTVAERQQHGRAARGRRARSSLASYTAAPDRPDPVQLLTAQEVVRVKPLLPLRHSRMSVSAFTFYRGAAAIMASDLGALPNSGLITQLCGDAHLSNFGMFAAPDRSVVFDINDFDETNPGPFEWDVFRLATSFVLAGRDNKLDQSVIDGAATAVGAAYRQQMQVYAGMPELDIWYDRISVEVLDKWAKDTGAPKAAKRVEQSVAKARSRTQWSAISKMTEVVDGQRQFLDSPPLLVRIPLDGEVFVRVTHLLELYQETLPHDRQQLLRRYHVIDLAHKVVGVGSVGLLAFVLLMQGRDENDLIVLQAKQAVPSVLEGYAAPSVFPLSGQRVVVGQQLMQAASDVILGWVRAGGDRDFYIRQLRDMKFALDPTTFTAGILLNYANLCGRALARAHARAGDSVAIAAYLGSSATFDTAVRDFAFRYADQAALDFEAYTAAIASGAVGVAKNAEDMTYAFVIGSSNAVEMEALGTD